MKADLEKAGERIAKGECITLLAALLAERVNVFYVLELPEWKMTSMDQTNGLDYPYPRTRREVQNYWLTRIAMMTTMPPDMVDESL
ncbi:MAG: hypothetical protein ACO1HP_15060 [Bacteroidota bacterium]